MSRGRTTTKCNLCGASDLYPFYRVDNAPARSIVLCRTREEALSWPSGSIELVLCSHCGFVQNDAYNADLQDFTVPAEETQGFSPRFRRYMEDLANDLVTRHKVNGGTIVEIGCGRGEFLAMICGASGAKGTGMDPSLTPHRISVTTMKYIDFIADRFENHLDQLQHADMIICRHTLEHIQHVREFMTTLRQAVGDYANSIIVIEVPDFYRVLSDNAFWDIYHEHCSYFTPATLQRLFQDAGFLVIDSRLEYDEQYIIQEAVPGIKDAAKSITYSGQLHELVREFSQSVNQYILHWQRKFDDCKQTGKRVAIWGSGSKAVAFLTALGDYSAAIDYVVDVNPHKHGTWSPGTGHAIVGPDMITQNRPDLIMVMNPVYLHEIESDVRSRGVDADLTTLETSDTRDASP